MNPFDMLHNHPFWAIVTWAVLIWYSTITVYVAIRGSMDIKSMLRRLADQQNDAKADADRT
jgi:hypothetical protein